VTVGSIARVGSGPTDNDGVSAEFIGHTGSGFTTRAAATNSSSTTGVFKVALRLDGAMDQTRCATGQKAMAYLVPQRMYCLQPAGR
jgi:hypothetical protein